MYNSNSSIPDVYDEEYICCKCNIDLLGNFVWRLVNNCKLCSVCKDKVINDEGLNSYICDMNLHRR